MGQTDCGSRRCGLNLGLPFPLNQLYHGTGAMGVNGRVSFGRGLTGSLGVAFFLEHFGSALYLFFFFFLPFFLSFLFLSDTFLIYSFLLPWGGRRGEGVGWDWRFYEELLEH